MKAPLALGLLALLAAASAASAVEVGPRIALSPMAPVIGERRALEQQTLRALADLRAQQANTQKLVLEAVDALAAARNDMRAPVDQLRSDLGDRLDALDRSVADTTARVERLERGVVLCAAVFWLWLTAIWIRLRARTPGTQRPLWFRRPLGRPATDP